MNNIELPQVDGYNKAVTGMIIYLADLRPSRATDITNYVRAQIISDAIFSIGDDELGQAVGRKYGAEPRNTWHTPGINGIEVVDAINRPEDVAEIDLAPTTPQLRFGQPLLSVLRDGIVGLRTYNIKTSKMFENKDPRLAARGVPVVELADEMNHQKWAHEAEALVINFFLNRNTASKASKNTKDPL